MMSQDKPSDIVRTAIKREGKFDAIRKKSQMNIKADGYEDELMVRVKADVDEIMKSFPEHWTKEQMRIRIKNHLMHGSSYGSEIKCKVDADVAGEWVEQELATDIEKKVRTVLSLPEKEEMKRES